MLISLKYFHVEKIILFFEYELRTDLLVLFLIKINDSCASVTLIYGLTEIMRMIRIKYGN